MEEEEEEDIAEAQEEERRPLSRSVACSNRRANPPTHPAAGVNNLDTTRVRSLLPAATLSRAATKQGDLHVSFVHSLNLRGGQLRYTRDLCNADIGGERNET